MKKSSLEKKWILTAVSILLCLLLASCSNPAKDVDDLIGKIGEVTLGSEQAIQDAEAAFEKLSESDREKVTLRDTLDSARAVYDVMKKIDSIGEVTLESEALISGAEEAYAGLSEEDKAKIGRYEELVSAREQLDELKEKDRWENNIARVIWKKMGAAGNKNMASAWELKGLFSFGVTDADGSVTLFLDENDPQMLRGDISFRLFPYRSSEVTGEFIPMLKTLMEELLGRELSSSELTLMDAFETVLPLCVIGDRYYNQENKKFNIAGIDLLVKYQPEYHEMYVLLSPPAGGTAVWTTK